MSLDFNLASRHLATRLGVGDSDNENRYYPIRLNPTTNFCKSIPAPKKALNKWDEYPKITNGSKSITENGQTPILEIMSVLPHEQIWGSFCEPKEVSHKREGTRSK